jgi:hypothetical protein
MITRRAIRKVCDEPSPSRPAHSPNWRSSARTTAWRANIAASPRLSESQHKPSSSASARRVTANRSSC